MLSSTTKNPLLKLGADITHESQADRLQCHVYHLFECLSGLLTANRTVKK